MSYRLEFNDEADLEFRDAYLWYENRQKGLSERFINSVQACLQTIIIHPAFFAVRKRSFGGQGENISLFDCSSDFGEGKDNPYICDISK